MASRADRLPTAAIRPSEVKTASGAGPSSMVKMGPPVQRMLWGFVMFIRLLIDKFRPKLTIDDFLLAIQTIIPRKHIGYPY